MNPQVSRLFPMTDVVRLDAVSKIYGRGQGAVAALREVSVGIPRGTFTAVMGPSGSGKSTFLHCAAGLDVPSSGSVRLGDTELARMNETALTELRRQRVGFVFQSFNLVSALTVIENITLPLRLAGVKADQAWLAEIVRRVGLEGRTGHRPAQLSGGQQQRVALARAIVFEPRVLLMDEPLGALDKRLREQLQLEIKRLHRELGITFVFVTHDQEEALTMSDSIALLREGRIVQVGTPEDLYERPASRYVAEFLGESNLLGPLLVRPQKVRLGVPGEDLPQDHQAHDGKVAEVIYLGSGLRVEVELRDGTRVVARTETRPDQPPRPGDAIVAHWSPQDCVTVPDLH